MNLEKAFLSWKIKETAVTFSERIIYILYAKVWAKRLLSFDKRFSGDEKAVDDYMNDILKLARVPEDEYKLELATDANLLFHLAQIRHIYKNYIEENYTYLGSEVYFYEYVLSVESIAQKRLLNPVWDFLLFL